MYSMSVSVCAKWDVEWLYSNDHLHGIQFKSTPVYDTGVCILAEEI